MRTKTLDDSTEASHPGNVNLSHAKLKRFHPELYSTMKWLSFLIRNPAMFGSAGKGYWRTHIEEHLMYGDSRAAVVVSTRPLLVAAYTDEIDCVALLQFEASLVEEYGLEIGSRLLTINTYSDFEGSYEKDLTPGRDAYGQYGNFSPFIAEFLTDDFEILERRKEEIEEDEWLRAANLADEYISKANAKARDGRPLWCMISAELSLTD
jgi:hypothetical protein